MNRQSWILMLIVIFVGAQVHAAQICIPKEGQDTFESSGHVEFICGKGKKAFTAYCDFSQDPKERSRETWVKMKSAKWIKQGNVFGVDAKGFIPCSKP